MPELPEVETTRRGIAPLLEGRRVSAVAIREQRLRWPIPAELAELLPGKRVLKIERRAKYLLLRFGHGGLILHLGMSGSLRVLPAGTPAGKHDHFDLLLDSHCLRLRDPRRFGAVLWQPGDPLRHPLLEKLGPEPLSDAFTGDHLHRLSRGRRLAVKSFLMDSKVVVGVGNIYASEALFQAGIYPARSSGRVSAARYERLAEAVRQTLRAAIEQGGTTLQDFRQADGSPGYFARELQVYGRREEPCPNCGAPIRQKVIGQRSSYYCARCQR